MPEKNILVIVKSKPFSILNHFEALRVAVGLWEHKVKLIWMGDGVYAALRDADRALTGQFLDELPGLDVELYVDERVLKERSLRPEDVLPGIRVVDEEAIIDLIHEVHASLVF